MTPPSAAHPAERDLLQQAFQTFDQAAHTLQQSYSTLTQRIEQMDVELAQSNDALRAQLRENEAMRLHLSGILNSLTTGVLVLDDAGKITRANAAAVTLLGVTQEALLEQPVAQVLERLHVCVSGHPQRVGQRLLTLSRSAMEASSGSPSGSLLLVHDVSQMCELEERLQRQHRLAAMGEMVGRIAHEIRNPLGSVELFASMLRRDLHEMPRSLGYAEQISQAVHGLDRLLSNLLLYTRPERSSRAWHRIEPLVLDALSLASHAMAKSAVDIRLNLDPRIPSLWCNEGQLKQVLLNLILNAVQAMPAGGRLTLALTGMADQPLGEPSIRMTVTDSGQGIDPANRQRIFDPFFTTKDEGTGLGLAIVHAIIDAHHGRIDVESRVGEGTTFTILLPQPAGGDDVTTDRCEMAGVTAVSPTPDARKMEDRRHD
ncbi:MAG: ATP-binding protein [Nitrospira sp.]|jgi:two-component system sensor histidine kinase FlrB|nr:ATP-binding protein [Nitrospira sp.]